MRGRVLLWVSLGLNIALAAMLVRFSPEVTVRNATLAATPPPVDATKSYKTNVVVRRQNFTWDEIESADYATYISNLRAIGCPEATIRDIIVADVNQLFARRRATEVVGAEQQWWRSEPDPEVTQAASEKLNALEAALRNELHGMPLTPDEFRNLFRLTDSMDQQLQLLAGSDDAASLKHRQEVEQQRDQAIQQVLGPDDYKKYGLLQDPIYRDTQTVA